MHAPVGCCRPGVKGHVYATMHDSLQLRPDYAACLLLRQGPLQLGVQARQSNTTEHDDAANTYLKESSLKVVYSANVWDSYYGRPESWQVGLDVQDLGQRVSASYFHHSKRRLRNAKKVYWTNVSYGAEFVRSERCSAHVMRTRVSLHRDSSLHGATSACHLEAFFLVSVLSLCLCLCLCLCPFTVLFRVCIVASYTAYMPRDTLWYLLFAGPMILKNTL